MKVVFFFFFCYGEIRNGLLVAGDCEVIILYNRDTVESSVSFLIYCNATSCDILLILFVRSLICQ